MSNDGMRYKITSDTDTCSNCNGSGYVNGDLCPHCGGSGYVWK